MAGPLGAAQAMLKQGHYGLLGAGGLISQFRVETVSFLGVVSNRGLSATRSKGPVGSARSRVAADALAVPRSPSAMEASTPRALVQRRQQMASGVPLGADGRAPWGLLLAPGPHSYSD